MHNCQLAHASAARGQLESGNTPFEGPPKIGWSKEAPERHRATPPSPELRKMKDGRRPAIPEGNAREGRLVCPWWICCRRGSLCRKFAGSCSRYMNTQLETPSKHDNAFARNGRTPEINRFPPLRYAVVSMSFCRGGKSARRTISGTFFIFFGVTHVKRRITGETAL